MSKPSTLFTPLLPTELWREIFQLAAFIHGELDTSSTMVRPELSATWNMLQSLAWEKVLPCRVAIQGVSRSWHSIGMELLYRSFHHIEPAKVRLFARTLCTQPSYGVLVKRLTLCFTFETMSAAVSIVQNCPKLLVHSTILRTCTPEMGWHAYLHPTSLRHFDVVLNDIPSWDLFAALAQCPNLELLALHDVLEKEKPLPAPARSIPLSRLRLLRLARGFDPRPYAPTIEIILSSLSLPRLTALSLDMWETSSPLSLCKDLLSRLTYLDLEELPPRISLGSLRATDFPRLCIFRLNTYGDFRGTLLSECPNLPIHQIDTLILCLPILESDEVTEWISGLHGILTEARDSKLMPKLTRVILEEDRHTFHTFRRSDLDYEVLTACFNPLADMFESRGVELLIRTDGIWEGDTPVRDFIEGIEGYFLDPSSDTSAPGHVV
jgi:hypothetical protein